VWRVENGRLVERWAEDDLWGLMRQLSPDEENIGIVRRLREIVNGRRYDEMDALFSPSFVDHNPAWDVKGLDDLKGIIRAAHVALDMQITEDQLFAGTGGHVVLGVIFNGRHVGEFLGRQPTGKAVTWTSTEVYRLENGRIVERWVQADTAGLMRQLGVPLP
jgi:predicted ester cyclase